MGCLGVAAICQHEVDQPAMLVDSSKQVLPLPPNRRLASTQLIEAIEGLALERPPLPISSIHRQASAMAETLQERKPSYAVVHRIVRNLPAGLLMLAHRGNKAYSEGFDLVHRREALKPNSIWQVDHAQLDIKLLREDGSVGKPWLTIVIDDYSRAVAGYYLGFEAPSSLRTSLALRQGIWRKGDPHWQICGIPDVLYTDNGSDFRSKHLEQVAADLKMRLVFSTPGQPQGRGRIERFSARSTRCSCATWTATPQGPDERRLLRSTLSKSSSTLFCWRSTIDVPVQKANCPPKSDGNKVASCHACPTA
jgi:transposase InsO family protein